MCSKEYKRCGKRSGVIRVPANLAEEAARLGASIAEHTKPELFVVEEERLPAVKHGRGDREAGAKFFNRAEMCKEFRQDAEDKEKAVSGIGNHDIREHRMGMPAACTDDAADDDAGIDRLSGNKVNEGAVIGGMGIAAAFCAAPGTDLRITGISFHETGE